MEGLVRYETFISQRNGRRQCVRLLVIIYALIFIIGLRTYIQWQSVNLVLGIASLYFCTKINKQQKGSRRFGYLAALLIVMVYWMPVKTVLYVAILSGIAFLVEAFYGRINNLAVLAVLLMSPFFQYLSNIFLFPVRLALSQWAGYLLQFSANDISVQGNVIGVGQQEFSVDPACMGLNMMVVSLLMAVMLTGIYQRRYAVQLHPVMVLGIMKVTLGLNLVGNLLRIILLVHFSILPGDVMHEITGIACLLVYVVVPMIFLIKWSVKRFGAGPCMLKINRRVSIFPHLLLVALHVLLTIKVLTTTPVLPKADVAVFAGHGYTAKVLEDDIIKLDADGALVYIKPIHHFYSADHNPTICWKGSGYKLEHVDTRVLAGIRVYTAKLIKESEVLYTAWWYDNGTRRTISQLDWRWNMLKGPAGYALVNVTTGDSNHLEAEIKRMLALMESQSYTTENDLQGTANRNQFPYYLQYSGCGSILLLRHHFQ